MDAEGLVTVLNAVNGVQAGLDESKLQLPAVWVVPTVLVRTNLAGEWTEQVQLRLMVSGDAKRARKALRDLFTKVNTVVDPDGDVQYATVARPSGGQPVPALVFPLDLLP